jgi:hypothetical protein
MELRFLTGRDSSKHAVLQQYYPDEGWQDVPAVKFIDTLLGKREGEKPNKHLPEDYRKTLEAGMSSEFAWFDLPWKYDKDSGVLSDKHDGALISTAGYGASDVTDEQGEFIVQACNSYHRREALLREGLRLLKQWTTPEEAGQDPQEWEAFVEQCEAELKGGE